MVGIRPAVRIGARIVRRSAVRKGFLGGSRGWQIVGAAYFGGKFVKSALRSEPEHVASETVQMGEAIRIGALDPRSLRRKRRS